MGVSGAAGPYMPADPNDPLPGFSGFGYGTAMAKYRASKKKSAGSAPAAQPQRQAAAPTKARPGKRVRTGLGSAAQTADRTLLGN